MQRVVGIIGGMGPLATVDLMNKIISYTPAMKDQDHIHIIADNYSQIPDRTTAILGKGIDPTLTLYNQPSDCKTLVQIFLLLRVIPLIFSIKQLKGLLIFQSCICL